MSERFEPGSATPAVVEPVPSAVRQRVSRQRRRDTAPETALRRELHRRGLRFRVDHPLVGSPRRRGDIASTRARIVVFVDGCFGHGCPVHGTSLVTRAEWWTQELKRNVARDRDTDARLTESGWVVLRFWEHVDPLSAADAVERSYRVLRDEQGQGAASGASPSRLTPLLYCKNMLHPWPRCERYVGTTLSPTERTQ